MTGRKKIWIIAAAVLVFVALAFGAIVLQNTLLEGSNNSSDRFSSFENSSSFLLSSNKISEESNSTSFESSSQNSSLSSKTVFPPQAAAAIPFPTVHLFCPLLLPLFQDRKLKKQSISLSMTMSINKQFLPEVLFGHPKVLSVITPRRFWIKTLSTERKNTILTLEQALQFIFK